MVMTNSSQDISKLLNYINFHQIQTSYCFLFTQLFMKTIPKTQLFSQKSILKKNGMWVHTQLPSFFLFCFKMGWVEREMI